MSRCFKDYDVKQLLRQRGCVPATREKMDNAFAISCDAHFVPLLINSGRNQR